MECNKIDVNIHNSASYNAFKKVTLKFIRPEPNKVFNVDRGKELTFFTRIRLRLSHLADYKFRYNFQDCVNPICSCGQKIGISIHFPLHVSNYHCERQTLFEKVNKIDSTILKQNDQVTTNLLSFGKGKLKAT